MKRLLLTFLIIIMVLPIYAQSTYIPYNRDYYHLIDRFSIKYADKLDVFQNTFKPIKRSDLASLLATVGEDRQNFSSKDLFNYQYLMNDNWEWTGAETSNAEKPIWKKFYQKKPDLFYYQSDNFDLHINPVIHFGIGEDPDNDQRLFVNTRGVEARGMIDGKIGFYTFLSTTEARFPQYVFDYIRGKGAFPNEGFWKKFKTDAWDFTHARAYITFNITKSIHVHTGYDKHFIGDGLRSMVLSDFSSPYSFLRFDTKLWKFQYTNLFAELTEDIIFGNLDPGDGDYPKKFLSMHRLGVKITNQLNFGLFETIISDKADINYFNPIIFYRSIELQQGSPHNILMGADFKWNIKNKFSLYGQFIIDEFLIDAIRSGNGDWRNKFGTQLGLKYIDAFNISTLDLQIEANLARPYFYAYERPALSYTNYRNPLAHPLGANFKELILVGRYQPFNKLYLIGKLIYSDFGEDSSGINYGSNLLLSTDDRIGNVGNEIGQGIATKNMYLEFNLSYMLKHNLFLDLKNVYRDFDSALNERDRNSFMSMFSVRWNIPQREHEF